MRKIEIKILILVIAFFALLSSVNESYAKYASSISNDTNINFKTWKILINDTDVTSNYSTTMNFTPAIISRSTVRNGKLAPGSRGYFDIKIDTSGVQTPYDLIMTTTKTGEIANLKVIGFTKTSAPTGNLFATYSYAESDYTYPDTKTVTVSSGAVYSIYYIRVFFEWIDNYNSTSTNASDTDIGERAALQNSDINCNISINLTFRQIV